MDVRSDEHDSTWGPLAVGHALSALEPADEEAFLAHLAHCGRCAQLVAETAEVMGRLAYDAEPVEPPPSLRESILAAVPDESSEVVSLEQTRSGGAGRPRRGVSVVRWSRETPLLMAVAASVVLLAVIAAGVWTLVVQNNRNAPLSVAAQCAKVHCPTVTMHDAKGAVAGQVMVLSGTAYVAPAGMAVPDSAHWYVLWRIGTDRTPVPIGGFHTGAGADAVSAGGVGGSVSPGLTFAVSEERAGVVPASPSVVVASGALAA